MMETREEEAASRRGRKQSDIVSRGSCAAVACEGGTPSLALAP